MASEILSETFRGPGLDSRLSWRCPPSAWSVANARLTVIADAKTDFWQKTHYGFEADNGHFLFLRQDGNFNLSVRVRLFPVHQYDQAGLMVRFSPQCWLKTSVEFELEGPSRLGVVVTNNGYSDWSTQDYGNLSDRLAFRITREKDDFLVECAHGRDGDETPESWSQLRLTHLHLPDRTAVECGLYACSPKEKGFRAEFSHLRIERVP
jgi:uncharacterized protein